MIGDQNVDMTGEKHLYHKLYMNASTFAAVKAVEPGRMNPIYEANS